MLVLVVVAPPACMSNSDLNSMALSSVADDVAGATVLLLFVMFFMRLSKVVPIAKAVDMPLSVPIGSGRPLQKVALFSSSSEGAGVVVINPVPKKDTGAVVVVVVVVVVVDDDGVFDDDAVCAATVIIVMMD